MGILDGLLGGGGADLTNLAAKVGLSPEHVETAVQALAKYHPMDVDTATGASAETGLPVDKMKELIGHIGGEGALGRYASMLQGEGGLGKLGDIASDLLGRK